MQFAKDLEATALHTGDGERAWRRADALRVARALAAGGRAILGGELWLVRGKSVLSVLPQRAGPPAACHWAIARGPTESWPDFVVRSCAESSDAIQALPAEGEVDAPPGAEIFYNLIWVCERE